MAMALTFISLLNALLNANVFNWWARNLKYTILESVNAFFFNYLKIWNIWNVDFERCLQESKVFSPIFVMLDGIFIHSIPEYWNAFSSIVKSSEFSSNSTVLNKKQFEKADFLIYVRWRGIFIDWILDDLNALFFYCLKIWIWLKFNFFKIIWSIKSTWTNMKDKIWNSNNFDIFIIENIYSNFIEDLTNLYYRK